MGVQGWEELLDGLVTNGTQISNTVTETIVCPDFNVPAYYMAPGRVLRITAYGLVSNVVTTPGTLAFWVRWGGVSGAILCASNAIAMDTTARTSYPWMLQALVTCRTAGTGGTMNSFGWVMTPDTLSSTAANLLSNMMTSAVSPGANADVTTDTTIAKLLSVTAKFSVSTSPTNLTCQQRIIEVLN